MHGFGRNASNIAKYVGLGDNLTKEDFLNKLSRKQIWQHSFVTLMQLSRSRYVRSRNNKPHQKLFLKGDSNLTKEGSHSTTFHSNCKHLLMRQHTEECNGGDQNMVKVNLFTVYSQKLYVATKLQICAYERISLLM